MNAAVMVRTVMAVAAVAVWNLRDQGLNGHTLGIQIDSISNLTAP
jgi:hypothetical protein